VKVGDLFTAAPEGGVRPSASGELLMRAAAANSAAGGSARLAGLSSEVQEGEGEF
jgi:hypothetical protein